MEKSQVYVLSVVDDGKLIGQASRKRLSELVSVAYSTIIDSLVEEGYAPDADFVWTQEGHAYIHKLDLTGSDKPKNIWQFNFDVKASLRDDLTRWIEELEGKSVFDAEKMAGMVENHKELRATFDSFLSTHQKLSKANALRMLYFQVVADPDLFEEYLDFIVPGAAS